MINEQYAKKITSYYDDFKKWWVQYQEEMLPVETTNGIAFEAWSAAINLIGDKNNSLADQIAACLELSISNIDDIDWPDMCDCLRAIANQIRSLKI